MYVVDASVHVADARPQEPYHAQARALLARLDAPISKKRHKERKNEQRKNSDS